MYNLGVVIGAIKKKSLRAMKFFFVVCSTSNNTLKTGHDTKQAIHLQCQVELDHFVSIALLLLNTNCNTSVKSTYPVNPVIFPPVQFKFLILKVIH